MSRCIMRCHVCGKVTCGTPECRECRAARKARNQDRRNERRRGNNAYKRGHIDDSLLFAGILIDT